MSHRPAVRGGILAGTMLFLLWLAWKTLSGGFRQIARSSTAGQKIETAAQLECGFLTLLVILTSLWGRRWTEPVRRLWSVSLAVAAGLSALVWGPPMPFVGVLFVGTALLVSRAVRWALRSSLARGGRQPEKSCRYSRPKKEPGFRKNYSSNTLA
jgi:hypothetical protein